MSCFVKNKEGFWQFSPFNAIEDPVTKQKEYRIALLDGIFIGKKGSGKTVALESCEDVFYELGVKIVRLTDHKNNLEMATCMFLPKEEYHIKQLKYLQRRDPKAFPVNILTPFSYNIKNDAQFKLNEPMPPFTFFTISIKKLSERNISLIFNARKNPSLVKLVKETINSLSDDDGIPQFFMKLKDKIKEKSAKTYKDEKIDLKTSIYDDSDFAGTITDIKEAKNSLTQILKVDRFIACENCKTNLDKIIIKLLNDNETIDQYTYRFFSDDNAMDIAIDCINETIFSALSTGKVKRHIQKTCDEITAMLPSKTENQKLILAENTAQRWKVERSKGDFACCTIFAGQSLSQTADELLFLGMEVFIGCKTSIKDLGSALKRYKLDSGRIIEALSEGEWHWLGHPECAKLRVWMPRHAHKEIENYNFFRLFAENYPEKMKLHQTEYDLIVANFKEEDRKEREYIENFNARQKERIDKQKEEEALREQLRLEQEEAQKRQKEQKKEEKSKESPTTEKIIEKLYLQDDKGIDSITKILKEEYKIDGWHFYKIKKYLGNKGLLKKTLIKEVSLENDVTIEKVIKVEDDVDAVVKKKFSKKKPSKLSSYEEKEEIQENDVKVLFLDNVQKFIGENLKVFGSYNKGDIVILPKSTAKVLIQRGKVKVCDSNDEI